MHSTYQFEGIDMLEHGLMVHNSYKQLLSAMKNEELDFLEKWLGNAFINKDFSAMLLENQYSIENMENYHIYHDCGKPYCRVIEDGKQHFPNHAIKSAEIYNQYFDNQAIADLILNDMAFHTLKSEQLIMWLHENKDRKYFLCSLYLTAWSEIIANSTMFGGADSTSFKIKKKTLINAGKKLYEIYKSGNNLIAA